MIITELDKAWCRAATVKLIRQGKLKRQPCEICGARETVLHHIDYSDPGHIRWLCKRHKSEEGLSALQQSLLRQGLLGYYSTPLSLACQLPDPGCFGLKAMLTDFEDRGERAIRRAAAGASIARLIKRRFLECCSRGHWRLSTAGLAVARRLYPDIKRPTKRQLAADVALRKAISQWEDEHPALAGKRRRPRARPPTAVGNPEFEKESPGVEVKLDLGGL
jgi:hypothetical protein